MALDRKTGKVFLSVAEFGPRPEPTPARSAGSWSTIVIGSFSGPSVDKLTQYLSIIDHFDDFGKGVLDTTHLVYYLSFITFGLFLTAKSVDSERWRG